MGRFQSAVLVELSAAASPTVAATVNVSKTAVVAVAVEVMASVSFGAMTATAVVEKGTSTLVAVDVAAGLTFGTLDTAAAVVLRRGVTVQGDVTFPALTATAAALAARPSATALAYVPHFPVLNLAASLDVLLPQYRNSERLKSLLAEMIAVLTGQVGDPIQIVDRGLNPEVSTGVLLDWLGARLGLLRPSVALSDIQWFGFAGTGSDLGLPFNQAPFYNRARGIEAVEPLGDSIYSVLLLARARRLRGGADRETYDAILTILFPDGSPYVDDTTDPVEIHVHDAGRSFVPAGVRFVARFIVSEADRSGRNVCEVIKWDVCRTGY